MSKNSLKASYETGYLSVGDGHTLYYELYGNPKGMPVLFFHGGPGSGFLQKHKIYFDPKKHHVILFDQRGSGKSTPFASIKNNTTQDLIADTNKLLNHLKIQKVFLFGRSWGATMALLFALAYPKKVSGMLIGGVFLASKKEIHDYYLGGYAELYYPEIWERFISLVPKNERRRLIEYYLEKMHSKDEKEKERYLYEWAFYELAIMGLKLNIKKIEKEMDEDKSYRSLSPLEAHYMLNNCFIEDNYILNNISIIEKIPTIIIQGRYDIVCPPISAYALHKKLKSSTLHFTVGGHRASDIQTKKKIIEEMAKIT